MLARRLTLGLRQLDVSARSGLSQTTISKAEQQSDVKASTVALLAHALGCSADFLLNLRDEP